MGAFFNNLLFPLHWLAELALVSSHRLFTAFGFDPMAGGTWLLSITFLVVALQLIALPFAIKGTRALQRFNLVQPQVQEIQRGMRGVKDADALRRGQAEIKQLYKGANTSIWAPLLPSLLQLAIFLGLYGALEHVERDGVGYGAMDRATAASFSHAHLLGVQFSDTITQHAASSPALLVGLGLIVVFALFAWLEQHLVQNMNMTAALRAQKQSAIQRVTVYLVPIIILVSSFSIPVSLLYYFVVSGLLTMVQQALFTYFMPTPTSRAAEAREVRLAKRVNTSV
jgi:YidC/Oxa1 family membrane protein insertase